MVGFHDFIDHLYLFLLHQRDDLPFLRRGELEIDSSSGGGLSVNRSLEACRDVFVAGDMASVFTSTSTSTLGHRGVMSGE